MSLRNKLFLTLFATGAIISIAVLALMYLFISRLFSVDLPRDLLLAVGTQAVHRIPTDQVKTLLESNLSAQERRKTPAYLAVRKALQDIIVSAHSIDEIERPAASGSQQVGELYIMVRTADQAMGRFLVMLKNQDYEDHLYDMTRFPEMMAGWNSISADKEIVNDEFGSALSVYVPIRDETDQTIALLVYDAPGKQLLDARFFIFNAALVLILIFMLISALLAFLITRLVHRPLSLLLDGMEKVAGGDFDAKLPDTKGNDQIASLFPHFNRMTAALKERRQLKKSLEIAADVQKHLLPLSQPLVPGWDIYAASYFCEDTGGDFFDFVSGNDRNLTVVIGDVSGHGIGSALMMASVRAFAHSLFSSAGERLHQALVQLNQSTIDHSAPGRFLTLAAVHVRANQDTLYWVSAGHEPILLKTPDGKVTKLFSTGIPLGIEAQAHWDTTTPLQVSPGQFLVIYTDGATDAMSPTGTFFSHDRLMNWLSSAPADMTAQQLHRLLMQAIEAHTHPGKPHDDVTLLVIKRTT
jgi:sigma-B regulation protein RsbU (phosphoserine phosphatase)